MERFRVVNDNGDEEEVLAEGENIHEVLLNLMRSGYHSGLMVNAGSNIDEKVESFYEGTEELRLEVVTWESHEVSSNFLVDSYQELRDNR